MPSKMQDKYRLRSLFRAFDLLRCFSPPDPEWGVSELAQKLGMKKSAVHRVLATFLEHEFVKQNQNRRYVLGPRIVELANVYRSHNDLISLAKPVLQELAESTGKTCHVAKLHEAEIVYLTSIRPRQVTPFTTFPTFRAPAFCTALGKVLLAYLPPDELNRIVRKIKFEKHTPNTITGISRFKAHLREVRRDGYAIDHEEGQINLRCIAAPILDSRGVVEAAMSLSGHASDINHEVLPLYLARVTAAADRISTRMGHRKAHDD